MFAVITGFWSLDRGVDAIPTKAKAPTGLSELLYGHFSQSLRLANSSYCVIMRMRECITLSWPVIKLAPCVLKLHMRPYSQIRLH